MAREVLGVQVASVGEAKMEAAPRFLDRAGVRDRGTRANCIVDIGSQEMAANQHIKASIVRVQKLKQIKKQILR